MECLDVLLFEDLNILLDLPPFPPLPLPFPPLDLDPLLKMGWMTMGMSVGSCVGRRVGFPVMGTSGRKPISADGAAEMVGAGVGLSVGLMVGSSVGMSVGEMDGEYVG